MVESAALLVDEVLPEAPMSAERSVSIAVSVCAGSDRDGRGVGDCALPASAQFLLVELNTGVAAPMSACALAG
jgi:hypothetical protein